MTTQNDHKLWQDAYRIAWIGACNKVAVRRTLEAYERDYGTDHIAVQAIRGHLEFLEGKGLGPEFDVLDTVRARWDNEVSS